MAYAYAIEIMPGHAELGMVDNLAEVVDRISEEASLMRPRRIYTEDLPEHEARQAYSTLEALATEHGYPDVSGPVAGPNRWCVDMKVLHHFFAKYVPCEMLGHDPWRSGGRQLPGIPLRNDRLIVYA